MRVDKFPNCLHLAVENLPPSWFFFFNRVCIYSNKVHSLLSQEAMEKRQSPQFREMGLVVLMLLCLSTTMPASVSIQQEGGGAEELVSSQPRNWQDRVIEVKGGPESVVWIVQLSDLHFSVHHPERALDFKRIVGLLLRWLIHLSFSSLVISQV